MGFGSLAAHPLRTYRLSVRLSDLPGLQFSVCVVVQSLNRVLTLCDSMGCNTPDLPVPHCLPGCAQVLLSISEHSSVDLAWLLREFKIRFTKHLALGR